MILETILKLNESDIVAKIKNKDVGLWCANEWYRLQFTYIPYRDGILSSGNNVERKGESDGSGVLHFKAPYSGYVYRGDFMNFRKDHNVNASAFWDKTAEQAGQKDKLIIGLNKYLRR